MPSNQSIKRAFSILKIVSAKPGGVGVTEVAKQINLHKSTVSRMLMTLEEVGAVERLEDRDGYRIGHEIALMAAQISYPRHLITLARPFLMQLAQATGETINLCIPDGDVVRYIHQIDSQYNLQIRDWTGYRIPLHASCDGKVILTHRTAEQIEDYLSRPLQRFSENTITDRDKLRLHLAEVREQGHAWTRGEYEAGITTISVPIWNNDDQLVATMCVGGPSFRFPSKGDANNVIILLKKMSCEITARL